MGWGGSGHTPARGDVRAVGGAPRVAPRVAPTAPPPPLAQVRGCHRGPCLLWERQGTLLLAQGSEEMLSQQQLHQSPGSPALSVLPTAIPWPAQLPWLVRAPGFLHRHLSVRDGGKESMIVADQEFSSPSPTKNSNVHSHLCGSPGVQLTLGANPPEAGRTEVKRSSVTLPALPFPVRLSSGPRESFSVYEFSHG